MKKLYYIIKFNEEIKVPINLTIYPGQLVDKQQIIENLK